MKKTKLLLHIGFPKTGTSFIQSNFKKQRALLLSKGVLYPKAGLHGPGHAAFGAGFIGDETRKKFGESNIFTAAQHPESVRDDILYEMSRARAGVKSIIVSSESFTTASHENLPALKALLEPYFDVRVLVFLRRQDRLAESMRAQVYRVNQLAFNPEKVLLPTNVNYNFELVVNRWASVFGDSRIKLYEYPERELRKPFDRLLMSAFNLPKEFKFDSDSVNTKLGRDVLEYIHFYTNLVFGRPEYFKCLRGLSRIEQAHPSNELHRYFYSPSIREKIIGLHRESNSRLEQRYNCKLFRGALSEPSAFPWEPYPGLPNEKRELFDREVSKVSKKLLSTSAPMNRGYAF